MSYSYTNIKGGKGNPSIVKFMRGTQEQFDKMDKTNMIKPELYMRDDTIYFVIPDDIKSIKVKYDDRPESIEENPFLQDYI